MSFFRHSESYPPRIADPALRRRARSHRLDEFPAGYSLAGCSPAAPASASPAASSVDGPRLRDNDFAANGDLSRFGLSQSRGPSQPSCPAIELPL